jgi:hypothetical protein
MQEEGNFEQSIADRIAQTAEQSLDFLVFRVIGVVTGEGGRGSVPQVFLRRRRYPDLGRCYE